MGHRSRMVACTRAKLNQELRPKLGNSGLIRCNWNVARSFDQIWPIFKKLRPNSENIDPRWAELGQIGADTDQTFGQLRPTPAKRLAKLEPSSAQCQFDRNWRTLARNRPNSAESNSMFTEFGPVSCQIQPRARTRPSFDNCRTPRKGRYFVLPAPNLARTQILDAPHQSTRPARDSPKPRSPPKLDPGK